MSHPLLFPGVTYFYAFGNTSAVRLTEHLPPEQSAEILLLACGDPRHILYTIHTAEILPGVDSRRMDLTCCDAEAAVLARNALLFTLLAEEGSQHRLDLIWNIFYHFKLDQESLSLLIEQSRKLQTLSKDLESWKAGPYSHFLTVCDKRTLEELHRFWSLYVETTEYAPDRRKSFNKGFMDGMKEVGKRYADGHVLTSSRSAGPLLVYATKTVAEQFRQFWTSGITDDGLHNTEHASFVNPTFAFSAAGDKFAIHYGLDPVAGFHLAEVFATSQNATPAILVQKVVEAARSQFSQWCTSVIKLLKVSPSKLVIRMFAGDALMLCRALSHLNSSGNAATPIQSLPWVASSIEFDKNQYGEDASNPAPTTFNVIDTSNVSDHVGLLNLLLVTSPILSKSPSATLYTEALISYGGEPAKVVLERLCGDMQTLSFVLGIIPVSFLTRFTSRSNVHEILLQLSGSVPQYYERVVWTAIDSKHPTSFDPDQLGRLLFGVYLKMFSDEDMSRQLQNMALSPTRAILQATLIHYNRRSFVELLCRLKSRVQTDWGHVMEVFDDHVVRDTTLLLGSNFYQEMCCHLHLLGITTFTSMEASYIQDLRIKTKPDIFRDWHSIPAVVTVVLIIPRSKITIAESDLRDAGTPVLLCEVRTERFWNMFAVISAAYGNFKTFGTGQAKTATIVAEKKSEQSTSPLIVFFSAPSSALMLSHNGVVGFRTRPSPRSVLIEAIFSTSLEDSQHVHILTGPPSPLVATRSAAQSSPIIEAQKNEYPVLNVQTNTASTKIHSFSVRVNVTDPVGQASLAAGSAVKIQQVSPLGACLCIDKHKEWIEFPLPVDIASTKLRIARMSKYIEVVAPLALSMQVKNEQNVTNRFLAALDGGVPTSLNVHRVNLACCPLFKPSASQATPWLVPHVTLMFSHRERALRLKPSPIAEDVFVNLKNSLHALFHLVIGAQGSAYTTFALQNTSTSETFAFIFVAGLRLDLSSHTILADTWVVLAGTDIHGKVEGPPGDIATISMDTRESEAWRYLLPLFIERCRTWAHRSSCEYRVYGTIPLHLGAGADPERSPFCTCGVGHGTETFPKRFKSLAPYATRAAISPLFAVQYLEQVGPTSAELAAKGDQHQGQEVRCDACRKESGLQPLRACGKCKTARYCSRECQLKDWKDHKKTCI